MVALCDAVEVAIRIGRLLGLDENAETLARSTKLRFWRSSASGVSRVRHSVGRQHERGTAPVRMIATPTRFGDGGTGGSRWRGSQFDTWSMPRAGAACRATASPFGGCGRLPVHPITAVWLRCGPLPAECDHRIRHAALPLRRFCRAW